MTFHQFNTDHAKDFGVNAAILLQNLIFWVEKNRANHRHFHDGRTWTYNSLKAWADLFPYLSKKQVRTNLEMLREKGVLITGNFSENPNDKTLWYAFAEEGKWFAPQGNSRAPQGTGNAPQGTSYIGTDSKPDSKPDVNTPPSPVGGDEKNMEDDLLKKENTNTVDLGDVEARLEVFENLVYFVGGGIYTRQMLENFINVWGQYDETTHHPKMRWEKDKVKKGWVLKKRLIKWAKNNYDKIQCYLSEECQTTIADKKTIFKEKLNPHLQRYGKDYLNYFFQEWATPENIPNPMFLKWEKEDFWDLPNKLAQWYTAWKKRNQQPSR